MKVIKLQFIQSVADYTVGFHKYDTTGIIHSVMFYSVFPAA